MRCLLIIAGFASVSCGPGLDRSIAWVSAPRILAVRAEPPESLPGAAVTYTALAVTPSGPDAQAEIAWSFCSTPPSLTDDSPVSSACITTPAIAAASGPVATLTTPTDACRRFGPQGMPAEPGLAAPRPAAPDATGGYYQPVRLDWLDGVTSALECLTCDPTGVSLDLSQSYRSIRQPNQNPKLLSLTADVLGQPLNLATVPAGSGIHLSATWALDSVESYVTIDTIEQGLVWHTERLWVAWFATGGTLDQDVSQPLGTALAADNLWRAPEAAGAACLWTILHDDRGGMDFVETQIVVQ